MNRFTSGVNGADPSLTGRIGERNTGKTGPTTSVCKCATVKIATYRLGSTKRCVVFEYDLTILAGARPELLPRTLSSFQIEVFEKNPPKIVYANIDPWGGRGAEVSQEISQAAREF